jgi:hypothetical protein
MVHRARGGLVILCEITHVERSGWQQRAARELTAILDAHRDLPIIGWTIGTAGAILVGHLGGPTPARQVRQEFDAWRTALTLTEPSECTFAGGTTHLRAETSRGRVRVKLTATVPTDADADGEVTL